MIEVRIPKEIRTYKEKFFFGLNVRQSICTVLALAINIPLYIFICPHIGNELSSWIIILSGSPLFLIGFFHYNGMPFEQFASCIFKFQILTPQKRKYKVENLYAILIDMHQKEVDWEEKKRQDFLAKLFKKPKDRGEQSGIS